MNSGSREEMSDVEVAMRKFLKQLGVTAHQELEAALAAAEATARPRMALRCGMKVWAIGGHVHR